MELFSWDRLREAAGSKLVQHWKTEAVNALRGASAQSLQLWRRRSRSNADLSADSLPVALPVLQSAQGTRLLHRQRSNFAANIVHV